MSEGTLSPENAASATCPCCGYLTADWDYDFGICDICGWEDDRTQLAYPTSSGGANGQSLYDSQQAFLRSESAAFVPNVPRDPFWHPFDPSSDPHLVWPDELKRRPPQDLTLCYWRPDFWLANEQRG